jgi:O-antigen ligase
MWRFLEQIFIVCALLFCAGAFTTLLSRQKDEASDIKPQTAALALIQKQASAVSSDPTQANAAMLAGQILVYGLAAVLLVIHRQQALFYLRNSKLLWAVVVLAFLSVLWSDVPGFALRRCLNMTATCGLGLYLACRYSPRQLMRLLALVIFAAIVCSMLMILLRPDLGIDAAGARYGWKGIFVQKNTFGRLMALGVLVFLFLAVDSKAHRLALGAASILCMFVIFESRSATSAMAVPITLSLTWLFGRARQRSFGSVLTSACVASIGIACGLMVFVDSSDLFALAGRDATLSGRVEIWSAVLPKIMAHPWLGYGYSSFWLGTEGKSSADLWSMLHWHVPHSHNGFLDLVEELGAVGLVLFLAGLVVSVRCGLQWARSQTSVIGLWPLAYISFMLLFNLSEGSILKQDNLLWVLYVATYVLVVKETKEQDEQQAPVNRTEIPLLHQ